MKWQAKYDGITRRIYIAMHPPSLSLILWLIWIIINVFVYRFIAGIQDKYDSYPPFTNTGVGSGLPTERYQVGCISFEAKVSQYGCPCCSSGSRPPRGSWWNGHRRLLLFDVHGYHFHRSSYLLSIDSQIEYGIGWLVLSCRTGKPLSLN